MSMTRVALYCRVSTDEQAKSGYSIPDQIRELTQHAGREGYELVCPPIVDDGYSGATPHRPGLSRVIELAEAGAIDLAIATKRDRWFRSRIHRLMLDEDMEECGCRLLSLNDTNNRIGDGVLDDFAEYEREQITERTRRGRMQKARSGKVVPAVPPYGFRRADGDAGEGYEPDPALVPTVRRVFEMVAGGASLRSVKRAFEEEGVPSPAGKEFWSPYMVRRVVLQDAFRAHTREELGELVEEGLLAPEVLAALDPARRYGVSWYGREEVRKTRKGKRLVPRPRSEWIAVPVPDAGIPRELVDRARAAIKDNRRPSRADGILWQLSGGVARCECGRHVLPKRVTSRGKLYHYYCCGSYWRPSGERCEFARTHPARALEARVEDCILALIRDPEVLRGRVEAQVAEERRRLSHSGREVAALRAQLDKLERKRRGYLDQQAEGVISMAELKDMLAGLDGERAAIERAIAGLGDQEGRLRELDALPALVEDYLKDLPYLVDRMPTIREYETVPAERTPDNPLGAFTLTPERIRYLSEEELEAKRLKARNERAGRFRELYEALGLSVEVRKDGTLVLSWSFGSRVLPGVGPAERSL